MKKQTRLSALLKCAGYALLFTACQVVASLLAEAAILATLILDGLKGSELLSATVSATASLTYEIMLLSGLIFLGISILIKRKKFAKDVGLRATAPESILSAFFAGFACFLAASYLIAFTSIIPAVQESQDAYMENYEAILSSGTSKIAEMLYICLLGPLVEEILCRGLILNTLKRSFDPKRAIFLTGFIFSLIHGNLYQIVFTLPLGILLAWLAHRFSSLWPSVALHITFNSANYLITLGSLLGFGEDHDITYILYYAALLLFVFSIPISILIFREAVKKCPPPVKEPEAEFSFSQNPFPQNGIQNPYEKGGPMATPEYLIVGLGNPGDKYAENRHNCGFNAIDYIALRERCSVKSLRFRSLMGESVICGKKVIFLKPQTFMNLSGEAVRECAAFYKIPPEKILVIFDDVSFEPGVFRIREKGSAGGHNGIKSIISCLSSDAFPRVKMGVGNPPEGWDMMHWVLGNPSPEDQKKIIASLEDVYQTVRLFVAGDLQKAAQLYNGKKHE